MTCSGLMVPDVRTVPFTGVTTMVCRTLRAGRAGGDAAAAWDENSSADVTTRAAERGRIERSDTRSSLIERVDDPPSKGNACAEFVDAATACRYKDLPHFTARESS